MQLSKEQQTIVDEVMLRLHQSGCSRRSILFGQNDSFQIRIGGYAGTGKQQPIDCLVQTPIGSKEIGKLNIGDFVIGKNGKPTKVTGIFPQGIQQAYKIIFRDGSFTEAGEKHLWAVQTPKDKQLKKPFRVITTKEIIDSGIKYKSGNYKYCIPLCNKVEYSEKEQPIHPYMLGCFIGDGTGLGRTPILVISKNDFEIVEYIETIKPCFIKISKNESESCNRYTFSYTKVKNENILNEHFKRMGLNVKSPERFIPDIYKYGSIEQRKELLKGLMDTDGSCKNNRTRFSTNSYRLANDVTELVQSLGGIAILKSYKRSNKNIEYQLNIKIFENPFRLKRKSKNWKLSKKNPPSRFITDIKPSRIIEQICISVDAKDQLYLTDNYIVTHNTTLTCYLREKIKEVYPNLKVAFATFTGKASAVLAEKLKQHKILFPSDYVGTIHKLIYKAIARYDPKLKIHTIVGWELRDPDELYYDLIIIDEASMISKSIWEDLKLFRKSIISIGDHGQLPPIGDKFSLMKNPDFTLQKIHRQALNSPIISLSQTVRRTGYIPKKVYSKDVFKMSWNDKLCKKLWNEKVVFDQDLMVLCGFNTTRWELNEIIRKKLGNERQVVPYPGEQLVCLSNNHKNKIMNGQIGMNVFITAEEVKGVRRMSIQVGDDIIESLFSMECFGQVTYTLHEKTKLKEKQTRYAHSQNMHIDYFDYGYALSVHKSQGSEWKKVVVFEERSQHWDDDMYMRWLYTAITRSSEKLFIISDYY